MFDFSAKKMPHVLDKKTKIIINNELKSCADVRIIEYQDLKSKTNHTVLQAKGLIFGLALMLAQRIVGAS